MSGSLVEMLGRNLTAAGIQSTYLEGEFARIKDKHVDFSHIDTDKDAILLVLFNRTGFVSASVLDAPFEPWVAVNLRLMKGSTKEILMETVYSAGHGKDSPDGSVFVPCAENHRFATFAKVLEDFPRSIESLTLCEEAMAKRIAADLKP
ncbi:MAG: hypothetical protein ACKO4A_06720 [Gammaproteobacteria bacterium]